MYRLVKNAISLLAFGFTGLGILCLAFAVVAAIDAQHGAFAAESAFEQLYAEVVEAVPDQQNWSDGRKAQFLEARAQELGAPSGVVRIPSLNLSVPVFDGTSELVLNRGAGWIEGTAPIGSAGNVGIAGHRDGFFRGLKDLQVGDAIEVATVDETLTYRVHETMIVYPDDVHVLHPTPRPALTLVTCYPFYFVGHAPQRYIVRAILEARSSTMTGSVTRQNRER